MKWILDTRPPQNSIHVFHSPLGVLNSQVPHSVFRFQTSSLATTLSTTEFLDNKSQYTLPDISSTNIFPIIIVQCFWFLPFIMLYKYIQCIIQNKGRSRADGKDVKQATSGSELNNWEDYRRKHPIIVHKEGVGLHYV